MKLQVMSDIHLEFAEMNPLKTDADVVVLAGDIGKGIFPLKWSRWNFPDQPIVYVPGNHEFYGAQRLEMLAKMRIEARALGIHFLDNDEVVIDGPDDSVRFLGSTLWTDFKLFGVDQKPYAMSEGSRYLSDFRVIQEGSRGHFSPSHSVELHEQSLAWLTAKLDEPFDGKTVVVTHHLPSNLSVSPKFREGYLSACFASNLDHLFGKSALWIHGHTHDSFDYVENGTRVICNPRGYETYSSGAENYVFDSGLVVEI